MITYVILFEESRLIENTHYTYHYYKKEYGNKLSGVPIGTDLQSFMKLLEEEGFLPIRIMNQEKPSLTVEEIFLNDVGWFEGFYFNPNGDLLRSDNFIRKKGITRYAAPKKTA